MTKAKKPPAPPPYRCGRGPQQAPQPFSEIELAWQVWRAAKQEEARLYRLLELAELKSSTVAATARAKYEVAAGNTRKALMRLGKLAYQAVGAIPHELPQEPHP
jgi:hypothetical protein